MLDVPSSLLTLFLKFGNMMKLNSHFKVRQNLNIRFCLGLLYSAVNIYVTDCSPPSSSVHGDSPGKNTGVGCHALLQGMFPT